MGYVGKKPTPAPLTASDVTDGIISNDEKDKVLSDMKENGY